MFISGWTDKEGNSITHQPLGMFVSPDGNEWSNMPYTKEERKIANVYNKAEHIRTKIINHLTRTDRTILQEIDLIKTRRSTLPKYCREWLLELNIRSEEAL